MINRSLFKAPYPFEQSAKEKWHTVIITSLLLSLIILFLQPYGFYPFSKGLIYVGYLVIGLVCLTINYFSISYFFPKVLSENHWTIWKLILFSAYNFIFIGLWNHVFNALVIRNDPLFLINANEIGITLVRTLMLGLLASGIYALFRYNLNTRQHLQLSQELNQKLQRQLRASQLQGEPTIDLVMENKSVSFFRDQLIYINSEGNYLAFHLKGSKTPILYRERIKTIEKSLAPYPEFFRCHRSIIINLNFVESSKGNSQGLALKLFHTDKDLAVSRSNIKALRRILEKGTYGY